MTERERLVENLNNDRIFAFAAIERCFATAVKLDEEMALGSGRVITRLNHGLKQKVAEERNKAWKVLDDV